MFSLLSTSFLSQKCLNHQSPTIKGTHERQLGLLKNKNKTLTAVEMDLKRINLDVHSIMHGCTGP